MDIRLLLKKMIQQQGQDLLIAIHAPVTTKVHGKMHILTKSRCTQAQMMTMLSTVMTQAQQKEFEKTHECNFTFEIPNLGRFRVNMFMQRGQPGCVIRHIPESIPSIEALHLPNIVKTLAMSKKGWVIVSGGAGSGKTSSLAAMIGYRNIMAEGHILTIEDPIEYLHEHIRSVVTQREIGVDTDSFEVALKNALRQAPDVIQIGEIQSANMIECAIEYAKSGVLCLSSLHAEGVIQTLENISTYFNESARAHLHNELALHLRAVIAQKLLIPKGEGKPVLATEVLVNTPFVAEKIRTGAFHLLRDYMTRKNAQGMHTFDQSLYQLCMDKYITYDYAMRYADSIDDFRLMIKLNHQMPPPSDAYTNRRADHAF